MKKILNNKDAVELSQKIKQGGKSIVLVGGCFDLLHEGHRQFLKKAKLEGDVLIVLLESDASVKKKKGNNRPINNQFVRAEALESIPDVDFIVILPLMTKNEEYDKLVSQILPNVIAGVKNDPTSVHNKRQARKYNAEFKEVLERIPDISTTEIIKKNGKSHRSNQREHQTNN